LLDSAYLAQLAAQYLGSSNTTTTLRQLDSSSSVVDTELLVNSCQAMLTKLSSLIVEYTSKVTSQRQLLNVMLQLLLNQAISLTSSVIMT
jgi:hypothetical protein